MGYVQLGEDQGQTRNMLEGLYILCMYPTWLANTLESPWKSRRTWFRRGTFGRKDGLSEGRMNIEASVQVLKYDCDSVFAFPGQAGRSASGGTGT